MRTYVGLVRDHSASMQTIRKGACVDYNMMLEGLQREANVAHDIFGTVVGCGIGWGGDVRILEKGDIKHLRKLTVYDAIGLRTPLWDSTMRTIQEIEIRSKVDYHLITEAVAYLVIVTTDGFNNSGSTTDAQMAAKIRELQATDQWTFVFRVPRMAKAHIVSLGIPEGNVIEWDQTETGVRQAAEVTQAAIPQYFAARSRGVTASKNFYTTDLTQVPVSEVKLAMTDITSDLQVVRVWSKYDGSQIQQFCLDYFGEYNIGSAYYQLTKKEKVQARKKIIIKHLKSGKYYGGDEARRILGLPVDEEVKLEPGNHGQYELFIQSTSVNRKLVCDTNVIYWEGKWTWVPLF